VPGLFLWLWSGAYLRLLVFPAKQGFRCHLLTVLTNVWPVGAIFKRCDLAAHNQLFSGHALRLWGWLRKGLALFVLGSVVACVLLNWLPPATTGMMLYRHLEDALENRPYQPMDYRWINGQDISWFAFAAVVAAEDQLFYRHHGFDWHSIQSVLEDFSEDGKAPRGASTITQQVAKNLFLTPSRNFLRKGLEAWFTVCLELFLSKQRILEIYLNIAEFGDHLFGIEAASQRYFGISASRLSAQQAALLAATLPNPLNLKADRPSRYLLRRQHWILKQMQQLGH